MVKAFLDNLEAVGARHQATSRLQRFVVYDKHVPTFHTMRRLVALVGHAWSVPEAAAGLGPEARTWRDTIMTLGKAGQAAEEWDRFHPSYAVLKARCQQAYEALHAERQAPVNGERRRACPAPSARRHCTSCPPTWRPSPLWPDSRSCASSKPG